MVGPHRELLLGPVNMGVEFVGTGVGQVAGHVVLIYEANPGTDHRQPAVQGMAAGA